MVPAGPQGLVGHAISIFAKMGAVCDVYDAITSNRPYKAGWDPAESLRKMAEWANGHFDPSCIPSLREDDGNIPSGFSGSINFRAYWGGN